MKNFYSLARKMGLLLSILAFSVMINGQEVLTAKNTLQPAEYTAKFPNLKYSVSIDKSLQKIVLEKKLKIVDSDEDAKLKILYAPSGPLDTSRSTVAANANSNELPVPIEKAQLAKYKRFTALKENSDKENAGK